MGAKDSKPRPDWIPSPQAPQPPNKPWQPPQQSRSNAGSMQSKRPVTANAGSTQNRQTFQKPHQQNPRQTPNQNGSQGFRQQPQQQHKPKKPTVAEVVQSLKQILEGYDGRSFTLEGIDALYRARKGESIPYGAIGFSSLSSFIESQCAFLTIFTGADGVTQILLRPPSYYEAVKITTPSNPLCANLQDKHNVSNLVHDEISQTDFNRLKKISETRARNGLTIQEFDNFHLAEFQTRIDFKGFSRAAFFRGLDDIVEMREDRDGIKLFSKTGTHNPTKMPNKSPASQNAAQKPHQSAGNKFQPSPGKKNQHPGGPNPQPKKNTEQPPKRQEQEQARHQQQKVSAPVGNLSTTPECSMRMLMGGRCLWIVTMENYDYVPTGCVAQLANMANDTVINELRKHNLEIRYIKRLEDQDIKQVLVNNGVARADEVVMTIPLKSVPLILRAFLGKDVDNVFMENLGKVSKEHVRNRRFGRPNRQ